MEPNVTALERAFQLARSGICRSMREVRARLRAEGYGQELLVGPNLSAQLRQLMREANPKSHSFWGTSQHGR